jgi:competence protein ComGC
MRLSAILVLLLINVTNTFAQNNAVADKEAYVKVITERSNKIVAALKIDNTSKTEKVSAIVRDQYSDLNDIYAARDLNIKAIKEKYTDKAEKDAALAKENSNTEEQTGKLHVSYLKKLAKELNAQQIDAIKDRMTYGVLPLTYRAYQEEILTLTDEQKKQLLVWLTEAREKAMDAESSDKKHAMFGKYKGKINNYLSAAGYDLKKEGIEWQKRIDAAKANH